jgi:hypothetical protein
MSKSAIIRGPSVSVRPNDGRVNPAAAAYSVDKKGRKLLILAEELFSVFDEADQYNNGRAGQSHKKHYFQYLHAN